MIPRLIVIAIILAATVFWIGYRKPGYDVVIDNLLPNLIAAAIVIMFVDIVIEARDQRRDKAFRLIGYRRIETSFRSLLTLWIKLIVGSSASQPKESYDLFSTAALEEFAANFDLNSQSDFFRPTSWGNRLSWVLDEERKKITECLDLYGPFFSPELIQQLEEIMDASFARLFYYYSNAEEAAKKLTGTKPNFRLNKDDVSEYLRKLLKAHQFLNRSVGGAEFSTKYASKTEYVSLIGKYRRAA